MVETPHDLAPSEDEEATTDAKATAEEATTEEPSIAAKAADEEPADAEAPDDDEATAEATLDREATGEEGDEEALDGEPADAEAPDESMTELLVQLGGDLGALALRETQLAIVRDPRRARRGVRDIAAALIAGLALVTAFLFGNVAAFEGLRTIMSRSLAALVLCGAWLVVGSVLALALSVRAGRVTGWRWWRVGRAGRQDRLQELERAQAEAEQSVRETLGRLAPAMTVEMASVVAGASVGGVVEASGDILEASDDVVEEITEHLPAGKAVSTVWDVVLMPGRFCVRAATTVLGRSDSRDR